MMAYVRSAGLLYVGCLWTLWALNDLKLDQVSFLQRTVAVANDCGIVNKNIRTVVAPNEAVAL